jgi:hypothetical protein
MRSSVSYTSYKKELTQAIGNITEWEDKLEERLKAVEEKHSPWTVREISE